LVVPLCSSRAEVGTSFITGFTGPETGHPSGTLVALIPACISLVAPRGATAGGFFRNGGTAGAPWTVELLFGSIVRVVVTTGETTPHRLRFIKTVVAAIIPTAAKSAGAIAAGRSGFVIEIGGAPCLLGGDAAKPNAFVGEEHGCSCQQELPELKNRVETPALEEEDAAAKQPDGCEEHVVVPGQSRFERPHEIEQSSADG
tara:strand:- start:194 stop:796 length:603 start_codon:yes stop_codon:yes gene_type:complete